MKNATHYLRSTAFWRSQNERCIVQEVAGVNYVFFESVEVSGGVVGFPIQESQIEELLHKMPDASAGDVFERKQSPSQVWVCMSYDGATKTATVQLRSK